jgi:hypothetical protein
MKKTNRQNKTGLTVNWPDGFYTMETCESHPNIPSLWDNNQHFILITLRVRLTNAIEEKQVVKLGTLKGVKGRPKLVFANAPVSQATVEAARNAGVVVDENIPNMVNVVSVAATTVETEESVTLEPVVTTVEGQVPETV